MENPSRATGSTLAYVYTGSFFLSISVQHFALLIRVCFMPSEDYLHSLALQKRFSGTLRMCLSKFLHLARGLFLYLAQSTLLFFFFSFFQDYFVSMTIKFCSLFLPHKYHKYHWHFTIFDVKAEIKHSPLL